MASTKKYEPKKKSASGSSSSSSRAKATRGKPTDGERPMRVAAQLRQEVARLIGRDLSDPRLEGIVVSNAWISADLRLAKIYFRIATIEEGRALEARRKDADVAFERASGRLRKAVTAQLGLRVAPELRFIYDENQEARSRIDQLLDEVKVEERDRAKR